MTEKRNSKKALLTASIAGLIALGSVAAQAVANAEGEMAPGPAPCYGINACKGMGDCGGKGHSCAGKNACKGAGFKQMTSDECLKAGGNLEAPKEA